MTYAVCGLPACPHPDPVYAGITPLPVAADPNTSSRPLAGGPAPRVTGGFVDDRASDGEADALRGEVQGVAVHSKGDTHAAL